MDTHKKKRETQKSGDRERTTMLQARDHTLTDLSPPWSDLPELPLYSIATRLPSLPDFSSFRHVCATWRSTSDSSLLHFRSHHRPPLLCSVTCDRLYSPSLSLFLTNAAGPTRRWTVGSSSGHLVLADSTSLPSLSLADPVTGAQTHAFPDAPLPYSRAVVVGHGNDCVLVAFNSTVLQCCVAGGSEWGVHEFAGDEEVGPIRNLGVVGDRLFGLTDDGKLVRVDVVGTTTLTVAAVPGQRQPVGRFQGTWLGACGEDLVVVICMYKLDPPRAIDRLIVRRFNFDEGTWEKISSLGGRAIFIDMSWGILSAEVRGWGGKEDCIYFTDPLKNMAGIFHLKDGTMEELALPKTRGCDQEFRWDLAVWILP